ncbi:hypothetical protein [Vibrio harveyi]|uniref:hypothetical protein n=1 Tax=Vibrio harveyi TaxID=669 RepID=UPI0031BB9FF2
MNLFGVKSEIKVKSRKSHFKKIRPVIEEWLKLNRDYIELAESVDNLYWYNERSTVSTLAGAVWRCGGFAQEEYSAEKGEGNKNRTGRVDLYFHFNGVNVVCEAKQLFIYLPKNNQKDIKKYLEDSLKEASNDLHDTTALSDYHHFGIALSFIVPYKQPSEDIKNTKKELVNALDALDCSFYASFEFLGESMIGASGHEYNEVILVGKIT